MQCVLCWTRVRLTHLPRWWLIQYRLVVDGMKSLCKRNNQSPSEVFRPLYELIADSAVHSALKVLLARLLQQFTHAL